MVIALWQDVAGNIRAFVNPDGSTLQTWPDVETAEREADPLLNPNERGVFIDLGDVCDV